MNEYVVTLKNGSMVIIKADKVAIEWPFVKLMNEEGDLVACWLDGNVASVVPASASTTPPPPAETP